MCNDRICFTAYMKLPTSIDIRLGDKTIVRATHHGTVIPPTHHYNCLLVLCYIPLLAYPARLSASSRYFDTLHR